MNKINILGINISTLNRQDIIKKIEYYLKDIKQHYIVTPNPEIVLKAQNKEEYFSILNNSDISVPDGIGLKFAALAMGKNITRFTGADLTQDILKICSLKKKKIAVVNLKGMSTAEDIKKSLKNKFEINNLYVKTFRNKTDSLSNLDIEEINAFSPDILFSAIGAPEQELFINKYLKKIPSVKLAIAVGGSFDFITDKIKRAPLLFRNIGLEWLWRLANEPKRILRIYNAVVIFAVKFAVWRFFLPFFYRKNVACFLYKILNGEIYVLLVERSDDKGHWQIPQGGTDGLTIIEAGKKEIREELNITNLKIIGVFKNQYKYSFKKGLGKYYALHNPKMRRSGYKGQKQSLLIAKYLGNDSEIKINYWDHTAWKWVKTSEAQKVVYKERKEATEKFINIFNKIVKNETEI